MKITLGSVVTYKVGDMEENPRWLRTRSIRKEVVGCVQEVESKKKF